MVFNVNQVFMLLGIAFSAIGVLLAFLILLGGLFGLYKRRFNELHNIIQIEKCWHKYGHEFKELKD